MKTLNLIFFISILTFSCSKKNTSVETEINNKFVVVDSFLIDSSPIILEHVLNDKLLFFNFISHDIVIYDLNNKKSTFFNKKGNGNGEYKSINPGSLRFLNDSIIGIGKIKNILKYDFHGNFTGDIAVENFNTYATLSHFSQYSNNLIALKLPQGSPSEKSFYQKNHQLLLKQNLLTGATESFAPFPEVESDLNDSKYFYTDIYSFYEHIDKEEGTYSVINSNDSKIFTYDLESLKLVEQRPLNLDYYERVKLSFEEGYNQDKTFIYMFTTSRIYGYYKYANTEYILYSEGSTEEDIITYQKNNPGFPHTDSPDVKLWLHQIENFKPKKGNVLLTNKFGFVVAPLPNNQFLIQKKSNEKDEIENQNYYYIAEIVD